MLMQSIAICSQNNSMKGCINRRHSENLRGMIGNFLVCLRRRVSDGDTSSNFRLRQIGEVKHRISDKWQTTRSKLLLFVKP